jgi:hypothetical protein
MNVLQKQKSRWRFVSTAIVFGMLAMAGSGTRAYGQSSLQGEVNLPVEARFGKTTLPAGTYRFIVQPVGISQTVASSLASSNQVLVSMSGVAKGGPIASVVASASKPHSRNPNADSILSYGTGNIFRSMYLENLGVVLEFYESKPKNTMHARGPEVSPGASSVKGSV